MASEYPKKMIFSTSLSDHGSKVSQLIVVEVLGENPHIKGGLYIRYPTGGTDTTQPRFLFELPEGLEAAPQPDTVAVERMTARDWRNDAFEKSAQIAERYGYPEVAVDIRALLDQEK